MVRDWDALLDHVARVGRSKGYRRAVIEDAYGWSWYLADREPDTPDGLIVWAALYHAGIGRRLPGERDYYTSRRLPPATSSIQWECDEPDHDGHALSELMAAELREQLGRHGGEEGPAILAGREAGEDATETARRLCLTVRRVRTVWELHQRAARAWVAQHQVEAGQVDQQVPIE